MSPSIQKSVCHLHLHKTKFDEEALSRLAKFHNLVSIDFHGSEIMTEEMVEITNASADNLQNLTLKFCRNVGDRLLDVIAGCRKLRNAVVSETLSLLKQSKNIERRKGRTGGHWSIRSSGIAPGEVGGVEIKPTWGRSRMRIQREKIHYRRTQRLESLPPGIERLTERNDREEKDCVRMYGMGVVKDDPRVSNEEGTLKWKYTV